MSIVKDHMNFNQLDLTRYLDSEELISEYLSEIQSSGNSEELTRAQECIERARGNKPMYSFSKITKI